MDSISIVACILIISILTFAFNEGTQAETLAEKLGYGRSDKLLIVHADDVGMCHSVNAATIDALKKRTVTCGSIMVPCPWFPEIAAYCRENPEVDLGLHLTLTSEWKYYRWPPVAALDKVPGLVDEEGYMWRTVEQVCQHATPEEVEIELRAQIVRAKKFGVNPTHLDSHMGTLFQDPRFVKIYYKLGKEYGIVPMLIRPRPELLAELKSRGFPSPERILQIMAQTDPPAIDHIITRAGGDTLESRKTSYHNILRNLRPGVSEIIVHLGLDNEELKNITSRHLNRYNDYRVFTDPETKKLIDSLGIKLIGWKDIARLIKGKRKESR